MFFRYVDFFPAKLINSPKKAKTIPGQFLIAVQNAMVEFGKMASQPLISIPSVSLFLSEN
jgi:hypothetical protein